MKRLFYLPVLFLLALASCKKDPNDYISQDNRNFGASGSTGSTGTTSASATTVTMDTSRVGVDLGNQNVTVALNTTSLTLTYSENIGILVQTKYMSQAYAVHLIEDFSGSTLANLNFYSVTREGVNAYDWVDDNLNNIITTKKDTVINNTAYTKIGVARTFTFTAWYSSSEATAAAYSALVGSKEPIGFKAYLAPTYVGSPSITIKGTLDYIAAKQ